MKYIGTFNKWIDPLWENKILTSKGQSRPCDWPPSSAAESAEYSKYQEAGYDLTATHWYLYEHQDLNLDLIPPWTVGKVHWWFTKMLPGQFMPVHTDPHTQGILCNRYWMPLQDYEAGHIFLYKDSMISNYKKGDVFMFDDEQDIHGAANIGHSPRIMLLVTEYVV